MHDVALFLVAAAGLSAVLYLPVFLWAGRRARIRGLLVALAFIAAVPCWRLFRHNGPLMFARLERAGAAYVDSLDRYYEAQGHYPATLSELGVGLPETAFGPFEYERQQNGQSFFLHIGRYSRDLFEMWWDLDCRCWKSDT